VKLDWQSMNIGSCGHHLNPGNKKIFNHYINEKGGKTTGVYLHDSTNHKSQMLQK
jgi:hypothetical protein